MEPSEPHYYAFLSYNGSATVAVKIIACRLYHWIDDNRAVLQFATKLPRHP
jgi:hypothetical protein